MSKAEIKLLIEDDTITFDCDNMEQVTMTDLVDCLRVLAGAVKLNGGTDLLIMASVLSGIGEEE